MKQLPENFLSLVDRQIIYMLGALAAVLIFFQANLAIDKFKLNMNCADVLGICGATIAVLNIYQEKKFKLRLKYITTYLLMSSLAFAVAFILSCFKQGFTSFAFVNKFLGYYILLGYAALGMIFVDSFEEQGLRTLINLMTSTIVIILSIKLLFNCVYFINRSFIVNTILSGYASNRNAFALQLMCVACMHLCMPRKNVPLLSFLIMGVIFTYSRSAMITMAILLLVCMLFKIINIKELSKIIICTTLFVMAVFAFEQIAINLKEYIKINSSGAFMPGMFDFDYFSNENSNNQRIYSLIEAFKLWRQEPLFGIGLGGFAQHELLKNHEFLVIHNTMAWILTEFGLAGASVFIWFGSSIIKYLYATCVRDRNSEFEDKILLCLVIVFLLMSGAHEIFYQRIFWFIFGMILVKKVSSLARNNLDESMTLQRAEI